MDEKLREFIFSGSPFGMGGREKHDFLSKRLSALTAYHYANCVPYQNMLDGYGYDSTSSIVDFEKIPFLPVRLFKDMDLRSIRESEIFKTLTSSGTTGQSVSRIFLDKETASMQQKALVRIVSDFTGGARMPMILMDSSAVIKNRAMFSARGAGILGFSIFASDKIYAFDENMNLNADLLQAFADKYRNERILLFGFTYIVWERFYNELKRRNIKIDLSNAILIHGGGWKKLIDAKVSSAVFKSALAESCGIASVHDYYGMVEQTGCIYMECEYGHLHASIFSDIIIRNGKNLSVCGIGERGIIEVVSILPESYCGHVLLTEDEGVLLGEDDCLCGRKGKYFKVIGRIENAEIRGCSDTYAER
jgi:phenylacetate-coenzyme A ligase PaaK-like adenylate-forming protein